MHVACGSQNGEFIHLNGAAQPLATASVPQDVYTSATVSVGGADFFCVMRGPSANRPTTFLQQWAYGYTPSTNVTVELPAPLVVSGDTLGIELKLLVSKSATYSSCEAGVSSDGGLTPYAITPTFSLTSFTLPGVTATYQGTVAALDGEVSAVAVLEGDGSLHASRVEVLDPTAVNVQRGPLLTVAASDQVLFMWPRLAQGKDTRVNGEQFNFGSAAYQVSGEFSNVTTLLFVASFTAASMVAGQEASYDLFVSLALQAGETPLLTNPTAVDVYADADTQMLNSAPPAPGSVLRFYGLVFNDAGMLRMDCARISDGVNPTAPPLPTSNEARATK